VAAFIAEPVVGRGLRRGELFPAGGDLDRYDILFIADEVMTG
jgi:adenosylmethionine-8-amino-7-oxononanoate aminotransferase